MLIINNQEYSGTLTTDLLTKIIIAIKALPEPEIIPMDELKIESNNAVLCGQREAAYVSEESLTPVRYLGSTSISSCIVVYLHSETDHAVIHVDSETTHLNLADLIEKFSCKENIYVSLAGGYSCVYSERILKTIVTQLFEVSKIPDIRITINSQKIIDSNQYSKKDSYQLLYDYIYRNARVLYQHQFSKIPGPEFLQENKLSDFNRNSDIDQQLLKIMIEVLKTIEEIIDISSRNNHEQIQRVFHICIRNEAKFMRIINGLFSQQGYDLLMEDASNMDFIEFSLNNFVFDIKTGKIHLIPSFLFTPHALTRHMRHTQGYLINNPPTDCLLIFNSREGKYLVPKLNPVFIKKCMELKKTIHGTFADLKSLLQKMPMHPAQQLYLYIKKEMDMTFFLSSVNYSFQLFKGKSMDMYDPAQYTSNCIEENIKALADFGKFNVKKRLYPRETLDALLPCNNMVEAMELIDRLNAHRFSSKIIMLDNQYHVCVPAINVKRNFDQILMKRNSGMALSS